jgi:uncharacterized surface protein with fasciclin (FAS1) repeats
MNLSRRHGILALGAAAAGLLARPAIVNAQLRTLADTMAGDTRFQRFLDLVTRSGALAEFRQASPITVFAPTDQAFIGGQTVFLQDLLSSNSSVGEGSGQAERTRALPLIQYHIIPGAFAPEQLAGGNRRLRTLNGADLELAAAPGSFTVRNPAPAQQLGGVSTTGINAAASPAQVLGAPVLASNGILYPIDQVLFP